MNRIRSTLLAVAHVYVVFVAAAGFLFGQVFFADFKVIATLTGVFGVLAGSFSPKQIERSHFVGLLAFVSSVISIVSVAVDAYQYYTSPHVPGNSYPWILTSLFVIGLCAIAISSFARVRQPCRSPAQ